MPEAIAQFHQHPYAVAEDQTGRPRSTRSSLIFGLRLVAGDIIMAGDFYASTDGKWQPAPCAYVTMGPTATDVIWEPFLRKTIRDR
jgi:hypothetical protein